MNNENRIVELSNIEIHEHCILNIKTGEIEYNKNIIPYHKGSYFKDEKTFFALYPTESGPMMFYKKKEYPLKKNLHISLKKKDKWRRFHIWEYGIHIKYRTSRYIGFDVWSTEMDVDLFYRIEQSYKTDEFYEKYARFYKELQNQQL